MMRIYLFVVVLAFVTGMSAATPADSAANAVPVCTVENFMVVESTISRYLDVVNGVETWKARAEAITPTNCKVLPDTLKTK